MTIESIVMYGIAAVLGWLARHHGYFAGPAATASKGKSVGASPTSSAVAPTLRAEVDTIVKEAVSTAMSAALSELRATAVPAPVK